MIRTWIFHVQRLAFIPQLYQSPALQGCNTKERPNTQQEPIPRSAVRELVRSEPSGTQFTKATLITTVFVCLAARTAEYITWATPEAFQGIFKLWLKPKKEENVLKVKIAILAKDKSKTEPPYPIRYQFSRKTHNLNVPCEETEWTFKKYGEIIASLSIPLAELKRASDSSGVAGVELYYRVI